MISESTSRPSKALYTLYAPVVMFMGLSALALLCLLSIPFFIVLHVLLPQSLHRRASRAAIGWGFRRYLAFLELVGCMHFDRQSIAEFPADRSAIVIANHPSLLDAVILLAYLPNAVCVVKAALMRNILYCVGARMAGYVSNENPYFMMRDARAELERGANLVIFPESSRTTQWPINSFSGAAVLLSKQTAVPVQAVLIRYSTVYLGKQWGLFRPPALPLYCKLTLGKQFVVSGDVVASTLEIENYFRTELDPHGQGK
jgi:1-acyl-sn-glycerol-3-phosphate acyltransferase